MADLESIWTWREVCSFLQISRSVLYNIMRDQKFPRPVKIGGQKRFWIPGEVKKWVQECTRAEYKAPAKPRLSVAESFAKYGKTAEHAE